MPENGRFSSKKVGIHWNVLSPLGGRMGLQKFRMDYTTVLQLYQCVERGNSTKEIASQPLQFNFRSLAVAASFVGAILTNAGVILTGAAVLLAGVGVIAAGVGINYMLQRLFLRVRE